MRAMAETLVEDAGRPDKQQAKQKKRFSGGVNFSLYSFLGKW